MDRLLIAAVQLDYQPVTRISEGGWRLDEPLAPLDPLARTHHDFFLQSLKSKQARHYRAAAAHSNPSASRPSRELKDISERAMKDCRESYLSNLGDKLSEILTFCFSREVDLVVFPEYSVPTEVLKVLRKFSDRMIIIAGLGYLRTDNLRDFEPLSIDTKDIAPNNNVAVVLSPEKNYLLAKKHPAENESIEPGAGPCIETLQLQKGSIKLGVAICLDYIQEVSKFLNGRPDLVAIPALSRNTAEFVANPRNFLRVFANHSAYGGTYIGTPHIKGLFVDSAGTRPLPPGSEGIVILAWDFQNPFLEKVKQTRSTNHSLFARSALIYAGRSTEIAQRLSRIQALPEADLRLDDLIQFAAESHTDLQNPDKETESVLLRDALDLLEEAGANLSEEEIRALSRHCLLSANVMTVAEWKYRGCISIAEHLGRLRYTIPELAGSSFGAYEGAAQALIGDVRVNLLEFRHKAGRVTDESEAEGRDQLVLFARLGPYDSEEAMRSLPRQLTLLRTIADMGQPDLTLRYRLQTYRGSSGITHAVYDIICMTRGHTQSQMEQLRQGLGQLIHITFTGAYSIQYTLGPASIEEETLNIRDSSSSWVEIGRVQDRDGRPLPFGGVTDWSLIVDLLKSLDQLAVVEMHCSGLLPAPPLLDLETPAVGVFPFAGGSKENSDWRSRFFAEMYERERNDSRRLLLRIFLGSKDPLPPGVASAIGIEVAGANRFELVDRGRGLDIDQRQDALTSLGLSPIEVLRVFHPPFGTIYATSGEGRFDLNLKTQETHFPQTGLVLGTARLRQIRSDEEIQARLSEIDRLRHVYIVGKTGTGKTNLLKLMASRDVTVPGRGVTIIDPHGDLVDHILREIPDTRLGEVTLIDLSRTDALPVLNPLDLDRKNITIRDRTIQELILLMRSRVYHEYTGPRFDEMVRLAFHTMLDPGYSEPASFVEMSALFMDRDVQRAAKALIKNSELQTRWDFQTQIAESRDYGDTIHWLTSKFDEMARDSTLRVVIGGAKKTIDIERIVQTGGILLVRIPEAIIGKQAADFVGSLIMLQLRMAIIRRREFGKLQHYHFVYVDEFQNFANTDFHTLVAEARKFNIGFTLANQNLEQLREFRTHTGYHERRLIEAIFGNVGNFVVFSVGIFDANQLSDHVSVTAKDLMRIGRYEAVAKILVNGHQAAPFTLLTEEAVIRENPRNIATIEARMRDEGLWVSQDKTLREISGRLGRLRRKATRLET